MNEEDIELFCIECGETFVFTKEEQGQWAKRKYTHPPVRCKRCREERRIRRRNYHRAIGYNYSNEVRSVYRAPAFRDEVRTGEIYRSPMAGGRSDGSARNTERRHDRKHEGKLYHIICFRCGAKDVVPFRPRPGKKVYCHNCYENIREGRKMMKEEGEAGSNPEEKDSISSQSVDWAVDKKEDKE